VEAAGVATAQADDEEVVRALYAAAAARWVDEGRTAHYAVLPAHDERLLRAWFRLAFGHQHTHAARPLPVPGDLSFAAPRVGVRRATREDIPVLARLDLELPRHQGLSPTFSSGPTPTLEETVAEWEADFDDPAYATFVAEHAGAVVGSAVGCSVEKSSSNAGLIRPDAAAFLGFAAVFPDYRGLGAGRALGEAVLRWAAEDGRFSSIVTDWRETNLFSSRAWRALGYRDTFTRVHRLLGH
jgi:GNAT superfamily N-acetyltransferase